MISFHCISWCRKWARFFLLEVTLTSLVLACERVFFKNLYAIQKPLVGYMFTGPTNPSDDRKPPKNRIIRRCWVLGLGFSGLGESVGLKMMCGYMPYNIYNWHVLLGCSCRLRLYVQKYTCRWMSRLFKVFESFVRDSISCEHHVRPFSEFVDLPLCCTCRSMLLSFPPRLSMVRGGAWPGRAPGSHGAELRLGEWGSRASLAVTPLAAVVLAAHLVIPWRCFSQWSSTNLSSGRNWLFERTCYIYIYLCLCTERWKDNDEIIIWEQPSVPPTWLWLKGRSIYIYICLMVLEQAVVPCVPW